MTHVKTNFTPVRVCRHLNTIPPASISSIPSSAPPTSLVGEEKKNDRCEEKGT